MKFTKIHQAKTALKSDQPFLRFEFTGKRTNRKDLKTIFMVLSFTPAMVPPKWAAMRY